VSALMLGQSACSVAESPDSVGPIPKEMQGVWGKDGDCKTPSERIVMTGSTAKFGTGQPSAMLYDPQDGPGGRHRALHWVRQGVASNIEYIAPDVIHYHAMGGGRALLPRFTGDARNETVA